MVDTNRLSRRRALALSGSALSVTVAGCTGSDGDDDGDERQGLDPDDWEDVDEIYLEGFTRGFYGVEPDLITDIRNPAILLFEGREYELTWENGDGGVHNIAIRDENRDVVGDLRTQNMRDRGETQTLEFEATSEMHEYLCEPHPASMLGYFKVVD